jgi:predicted Zn-dependent protease
MQVIDDDAGALGSHGIGSLGREATDLALDGMMHGDAMQHIGGIR